MENKKNEVVLVQPKTSKLEQILVGLGAMAMTSYALADSSIAGVAATVTPEIDGAKSTAIVIFTACAAVLAVFLGWRYLKGSINRG